VKWTVAPDEAGLRLDKFLAAENRLGSRARAATALDRGKVFLNDIEASLATAATRLAHGDTVRIWMDRPGSSRQRGPTRTGDLQILFEDDALVVVNKPAGLLVVPLDRRGEASSVYAQIADHLRPRGKRRPLVVHRIDRDTSGLVVFAKSVAAQNQLKEQFKRRSAERIYRAVVYGHPEPRAGTWRDHLVWDDEVLIQKATHPRDPRGKEAVSEYRVLETFRETALIEVQLVTGKRNQIRIQARLRGHTLVGEKRYTYGPETLRPVQFERQALHAYRLRFDHPFTRERLEFEAALPADFLALLQRLRHRAR
jgi:23S rRNA pseudouridine1911/1915/1917 synthase